MPTKIFSLNGQRIFSYEIPLYEISLWYYQTSSIIC
jgi:hypothetical protein